MKVKSKAQVGETIHTKTWEGDFEELLAWQVEQWDREDELQSLKETQMKQEEPLEDMTQYNRPLRSARTQVLQAAAAERTTFKRLEDHPPPRTGAVLQAMFEFEDGATQAADIVWSTRDVPAHFDGQWLFHQTGKPIDRPFQEWRYRPTQLDAQIHTKD